MTSIRRTLWTAGLVGALALGGGAALVVAQDDTGATTDVNPDELLASAKAAIAEKKFGKALQDLNLLTSTIAKMRIEELKKALPDKVGDWTGEEATGENAAMLMGAGMTVKRRYTKGESSMQVELTADSPMVGMMAPLLTNPALMQGQEGQAVVTIKGRRALLEFRKGEKHGKLTILLNGNTSLLVFQGDNVQKGDLTDTFGKGIDLDKVEKALQN